MARAVGNTNVVILLTRSLHILRNKKKKQKNKRNSRAIMNITKKIKSMEIEDAVIVNDADEADNRWSVNLTLTCEQLPCMPSPTHFCQKAPDLLVLVHVLAPYAKPVKTNPSADVRSKNTDRMRRGA